MRWGQNNQGLLVRGRQRALSAKEYKTKLKYMYVMNVITWEVVDVSQASGGWTGEVCGLSGI